MMLHGRPPSSDASGWCTVRSRTSILSGDDHPEAHPICARPITSSLEPGVRLLNQPRRPLLRAGLHPASPPGTGGVLRRVVLAASRARTKFEIVVDHLGRALEMPSMVATLGPLLALILLHKSKRVGHGAGFTGVQRHSSTKRGDQAAGPRRASLCRLHFPPKPSR
jgi:hypothetical protein